MDPVRKLVSLSRNSVPREWGRPVLVDSIVPYEGQEWKIVSIGPWEGDKYQVAHHTYELELVTKPESEKPRCDKCAFSVPTYPAYHAKPREPQFECRRFPRSEVVTASYWCGEFSG